MYSPPPGAPSPGGGAPLTRAPPHRRAHRCPPTPAAERGTACGLTAGRQRAPPGEPPQRCRLQTLRGAEAFHRVATTAAFRASHTALPREAFYSAATAGPAPPRPPPRCPRPAPPSGNRRKKPLFGPGTAAPSRPYLHRGCPPRWGGVLTREGPEGRWWWQHMARRGETRWGGRGRRRVVVPPGRCPARGSGEAVFGA